MSPGDQGHRVILQPYSRVLGNRQLLLLQVGEDNSKPEQKIKKCKSINMVRQRLLWGFLSV